MKLQRLLNFVSLFFLLSFFCFFIITHFFLNSSRSTNKSHHHHQQHSIITSSDYTKMVKTNNNPSSKTIDFEGSFSISLPLKKIKKKDSEEGNHFLISNFGVPEYECTGFCFCEENENENKRSSSSISIFKRPIFYLISSVSISIAYETSKKYFHDECVKEYQHECTSSIIKSEVDECQKISSSKESEEEKPKKTKTKKKKEILRKRKYHCKGNCLKSRKLRSQHTINAAKEFGCEKLIRYGDVEVEGHKSITIGNLHKKAVYEFIKIYLKDYCREKSKDSYIRSSPSGRVSWINYSKCVATTSIEHFGNTHCIQTHPPPKVTNRRLYWGKDADY